MQGTQKDQTPTSYQRKNAPASSADQSLITPLRCLQIFRLLVILIGVLISNIAQAQDLTLAWDPNTEPDLDGYTVYYSKGSPGPPYDYVGDIPLSDMPDPENPQVTLTDIEKNVDYHFALTAYDAEGNESSFSNSICIFIDDFIQECAASSVASTPVVGSRGGSSGFGSCFIGTVSGDPAAVPEKIKELMVGWYSLFFLAGLLLTLALRSDKVNPAGKTIASRIPIRLKPKRPLQGD